MDILHSGPLLRNQPLSTARIFNITRFGLCFKSIDSMLDLRFERYLYIFGGVHGYRKEYTWGILGFYGLFEPAKRESTGKDGLVGELLKINPVRSSPPSIHGSNIKEASLTLSCSVDLLQK
jgi:hypothetical protein